MDNPFNKDDSSSDNTNDLSEDDIKHEQAKPPSVTGEEDVFSGDATSSEAADIDDELNQVGLHGDEEGIKPLGGHDDLE
ncbi:hypothetical protein A3A48_01185 [Candidatus Curtissbacteria bacterium RIFCSPLOWO2_01_FULL_37_9]|uniref:Uncharacterized protein n=1 Tax=Candidatus Curtissbacteria bacterium RIFCSPLOWO2_01_FULL_37_9 TaxID=1797724 RepID=A0A1F5GSJ7_9BACT|nr:MAG: hypothetical protein A3A48_01185 [Candidatus Curtissbacteria bacterium RIFCSPLOWO2_01_FULL_37_9]